MKSFYIGVKAIIVQDGSVLLIKRVKKHGYYWDAPGGRIDGNESFGEALKRELVEEIGDASDIKIGRVLSVYKIPFDVEDEHGLVLIFFKVEAKISEVILSDEHEEYRWVKKEDLKDFFSLDRDNVLEWSQKAIEQALLSV